MPTTTVPLSALQQRDVRALTQARDEAQASLNRLARTVIAGADIDPDTLQGYQIELGAVAIGLTPPSAPALVG